MLQRTLVPSFFFLCFFVPFLYLAYLHMIDQSNMPQLSVLLLLPPPPPPPLPWVFDGCLQVWGECLGVCGCAWVFGGWVQVWEGVRGCVLVCAGVRVCAGVCNCARVRVGVRRFALGYACMCGMNFQNFFRRIESLHQRTLIRILYEFFIS